MVDIGAESTGATADIVSIERQIDRMRPVVKALAEENILVSVETYHPEVGVALLEADAGVINLTGRVDDSAFYESIAKHEAGIILCYTPGETARSADYLPPAEDKPLPSAFDRVEPLDAAFVLGPVGLGYDRAADRLLLQEIEHHPQFKPLLPDPVAEKYFRV